MRPATALAMPAAFCSLGGAAPASPMHDLLEVARYELGHLEHRHLLLAPENLEELLIGIDEALVDRILQLVLLDVVPDLLGDFSARQWHAADDRRERARRR